MSAKKIRGVEVKNYRMEIAALTLLLGVLCFAFYDCNMKGSEQEIVLESKLLSTTVIKNKEDISMDMLALSNDHIVTVVPLNMNKQEENEVEKIDVNTEDLEVISNKEVYSINLAAQEESTPYNEIISNQVVNYSLKFVGGPYVYGGN